MTDPAGFVPDPLTDDEIDSLRDAAFDAFGDNPEGLHELVEKMLAARCEPLVARIAELEKQLAMPCGSCHPCNHWAAETWRQAGGELPHKHIVDGWKSERDEAQAEAADLRARLQAAGKAMKDIAGEVPFAALVHWGPIQYASYFERRADEYFQSDTGGTNESRTNQ